MLLHFVAHLHNTGLVPSSIISKESAISYFHKINGCQDPAKNFIISKLLAEAQNLRTGSDVRLSITLPILVQLIRALPKVLTSHYKCVMLRPMMVLAFKAYMRVGEMVPRTSRVVPECILLRDLTRDLTRLPSQTTSSRWQVDKEAIGLSRVQQFSHLCVARPYQITVNSIFKHIHTTSINTII